MILPPAYVVLAEIPPLPADLIANVRVRLARTPRAVVVIGRRVGDESRVDVVTGPDAPPVDGDTPFEIGSLTKTMTGTLLASAVRRGEVRLDEPIDALLPAGMKAPRYGGTPITLGEIATHRSGLPRVPPDLVPPWDPYASYDRAKLFEFLGSYTLTRAPGSQYEYSNVGFGLLGTLLADRAHETYAALARDRIFAPLGMTATTADATLDARLMPGYDVDQNLLAPWHFDALAGAGAVRSTANDLLRYGAALFGGDGTAGADVRAAAVPRADADADKIGLAWMQAPTTGIVWHNGATAAALSYLGVLPAQRAAVVVLTNAAVLPGVNDVGIHLLVPSVPLVTVDRAQT